MQSRVSVTSSELKFQRQKYGNGLILATGFTVFVIYTCIIYLGFTLQLWPFNEVFLNTTTSSTGADTGLQTAATTTIFIDSIVEAVADANANVQNG